LDYSQGVRREIRGLQPSAANLQHSPKQKSEKIKFGKYGYLCGSLCLKKLKKSMQKSWELC